MTGVKDGPAGDRRRQPERERRQEPERERRHEQGLAREFARLFDAGLYFEAHECLEEMWREQGKPELLQGLIQLAVARHHRAQGNLRGARRQARKALDHLRAAQRAAAAGGLGGAARAGDSEGTGWPIASLCQYLEEWLASSDFIAGAPPAPQPPKLAPGETHAP